MTDVSRRPTLETDPNKPVFYQIRVKGHMSDAWSDWFEGLIIAIDNNGDTLITGPVIDQAALHGVLRKVRDLGLPLISVNQVQSGHPDI